MAYTPRILAFAGSLRTDSYNKKLVKLAAAGARESGAEVTYLDLRDIPLPLYDGDLLDREGLPENARKLKELMKAHQGFLIASPEYNTSVPGVLKNAIDWASRAAEGEEPMACFKDKIAAIMSTSPGSLGGLRGLIHLRAILGNLRVLVIPDQITLRNANDAFGADGKLVDQDRNASVENIGEQLVQLLHKLDA